MWRSEIAGKAALLLGVLIAGIVLCAGSAEAQNIRALQSKERFHCNQARIYANKAHYQKPRASGYLRNYRNYCRTPREQNSRTCRAWYRQGMFAAKNRRRFARISASHRRACNRYRTAIRRARRNRRSAAIRNELRRRGYHRSDASRIVEQAMRHAVTRHNRRGTRRNTQRQQQSVRRGGRHISGSSRYQGALRQGMY